MLNHSYRKLSAESDDSSAFISEKEERSREAAPTTEHRFALAHVPRIFYLLQTLFFLASLALLSASYILYVRAQDLFNASKAPDRVNQPVQVKIAEGSMYDSLANLSNTYHTDHFIGTIDAYSAWKGPPSPEVDAAWNTYVRDQTLRISYEEMIAAGGSEASVKFDDKYGGGYMAYLEMPHQLHCLYSLWKHTWPSHYNGPEMGLEDPSSTFRKHLDHCADLLRQKLLCDADTTFITYNWVKHLSHPTPNFNSPHQCRNASAIFEWLDTNEPHLPNEAFDKPADAIELAWWP